MEVLMRVEWYMTDGLKNVDFECSEKNFPGYRSQYLLELRPSSPGCNS